MRIIDADALKKAVNGRSTHWLNDWSTLGVLAVIDEQPTIDAVPVVHGEWEYKPNIYICECTACRKYWIPNGDKYEYHYCPNCGAKMKHKYCNVANGCVMCDVELCNGKENKNE